MDALQADLSPTDLHVYVAAAYLRKADTRFYVPVSVVVPGSDVPFSRAATEDRATLDVLASSSTKRAGRWGASATR
jgi:hypothetical protein